ncbi:MAG: hypothetical protein U0L05_08975 [Schaedlerella sp.]|nr:hypothetical protein [Schaedlerella sp.]
MFDIEKDNLETLIQKIAVQNLSSNRNKPYVIAIDGMSASGKTTIASLIQKHFPESNLLHMDDFFLQPHQRTEERLLETGGNVDYERFALEILNCISDKNGLTYRRYDCCTQQLDAAIFMSWKPLVIIEGSYSHHTYFKDAYDLRIFCETTFEKQKERILKRNGAEKLQRFVNEWIPKENAYFEKFQIKEKADLLL